MESYLRFCLEWISTAVLFAIITIVVKIHISIQKKKEILGKMPIYPGVLPIIGHAHLATQFTYSGLVEEMISLYKKKLGSVHIWLGPLICGYVSHPADIENILNSKDALNKGELFNFFQAHSVGLLSNTTPRWYRMRKMANIPLAHKDMIKSFIGTYHDKTKTLLQILKDREGESLDIYPYLSRCCQDITYGSHFGVNLNIQHKTHLSAQETVAKSIALVNERMMKVWLFPDIIYYRTEKGKAMKKYVEHNKYIAKEIIRERKSILLQEKENQQKSSKEKMSKLLDVYLDPKNGLTEEEVAHEIMDLMLAGFETMSLTQSWVLLLLAMFPEHQEKVQAELDLILDQEDIDLESLQKCQYLDMVTKEALRLFGLPIVIRRLESDVPIENNYTIPATSEVIIGMTLVHRNPQYWEHPDSFYPDHFLPELEMSRPKYAFIPFGGGPRKCPAYAYGLVVVKFVVANLLRKYKFTTNQKFDDLPLDLYFMYKPSDGFLVKYEPR